MIKFASKDFKEEVGINKINSNKDREHIKDFILYEKLDQSTDK